MVMCKLSLQTQATMMFTILSAAAISGCSAELSGTKVRGDETAENFRLGQTTPDTSPKFILNTTSPFSLYFARRGAMEPVGLVVVIEPNGQTTIYSGHHPRTPDSFKCFKKQLSLSHEQMKKVALLIERCDVMNMHRSYSNNWVDGTVWDFKFKQGANRKDVWCSNHFPENMQDFAVGLDEILKEAEWLPSSLEEYNQIINAGEK